jgi:NAD-dependent dihydropyrimidine dehydrogenase PreA subunit
MSDKAFAVPNKPTPSRPIQVDPERCTGCNRCVDICLMDILIPNPEPGEAPIILYPEECYYDGCCVDECPVKAIRLNHPLMQRVRWKRKATGEHFRV